MPTWPHYFHFPAGTSFDIDGPFGYDGKGEVLVHTDNVLQLRLDLNQWGPAPAFHATVTVEYRKEGSGNLVVLRRDNEAEQRDDNATIHSNDDRRERSIASNSITCSVRYDGEDEIDFDVNVDGSSWDFDLKR